MTQVYTMVWPTHRTVSEDTIRMKYSDAVANGEVDYTDLTAINEIMDELENAGQVAFSIMSRGRRAHHRRRRPYSYLGSTRNE